MSDVASVLASGGAGLGGLGLVGELVAAAATVGLDYASAAALTSMETGGRNVWGHDPVSADGCYAPGGPVSEGSYRCVRASPRAGYNGAGPVQLTWVGYWDAADRLNGTWDPVSNYRVGFQALLDLQRQHGEQDGARAYNGSGPQAEAYGAEWLRRRNIYRNLLAPAVAPPPPVARPVLHQGDTGPLVWQLQLFMDHVFPAYSHIDAGPGPSSVIGPNTIAALTEFQRRSGIPTAPPFEIGPHTWAALAQAGFH